MKKDKEEMEDRGSVSTLRLIHLLYCTYIITGLVCGILVTPVGRQVDCRLNSTCSASPDGEPAGADGHSYILIFHLKLTNTYEHMWLWIRVEPASCNRKVAGLIPEVCMSKCPWARS